MSRKKNLSSTASLASCLDFAARVVSFTGSVQEICTKSVLAPMVVEAHRFGQHVMKNVDPQTPADVRRLLGILQEQQNKRLSRNLPLDRLEVADLTWDFEGPVATLEMELEELNNRAAMDTTDTCVVFSASSKSSRSAQAVIWFPYRNRRDEDERRGRQILLYVCPGRVKVVRSVGDLIKKMYEELPILREDGAMYNVWAVILNSRSQNQSEIDTLTISQNDNNQSKVGSILKASSSPINATVATYPKMTTVSAKLKNSSESDNQDMMQDFQEPLKTCEDAEPQHDSLDSDKLLPGAPRFSACKEVIDHNKSIFSFGVPQKDVQKKLSEPVIDDVHVSERVESVEITTKPNDANVEDDANAEHTVKLSRDTQEKVVQTNRDVISVSLPHFSNGDNQQTLKTEDDSDLGVAWQSCDGKILRRSVRLLHKSLQHDDRTSACKYTDETSEVEKPECEGRDELLYQTTLPTGNNSLPSPRVDSNANQTEGDTQPASVLEAPKLTSSVEMAKPVAVVEDRAHFDREQTDEGISRSQQSNASDRDKDEMDKSNSSRLSPKAGGSLPEQKTKVNYKDKLGARVWWEIEYIARKLEREEMIERQQQAFAHHVNSHARQKHRSSTKYYADSRKVTSVGYSTEDRTMKGKDTSTGMDRDDSSDNRIKNEERIDRAAVLEPGKTQENYNNTLVLSNLRKEDEAPVIGAIHPSGCLINENSPIKTTLNGQIREKSIEREPNENVEISRLSTESSKCEKTCAAGRISAIQGGNLAHEANQTPTIPLFDSISNVNKPDECSLNKSCERRQSMNSTERVSVKSSCLRQREFIESPISKPTNQGEDDDDTMAQEIWASTITSYERHQIASIHPLNKENEVQTTEDISVLPFNIRGRVPVRTRKVSSRTATDEISLSSRIDSMSSHSSFRCKTDIPSKETIRPLQKPLNQQESFLATPAQPAVSTFIALHEDNSDLTTPSTKTRQERLKELRQKKLQKLQQTRDMSLQHQKEKQDKRNRPLSFANSVYSKASNRQLMQNALEFTLLAGGSMERERTLALQALAESTCDNFIVLLKSAKELQFRALYENHVERNSATRIFSVLPSHSARAPLKIENSDSISQFFKYSSAKKQFLPVPTRSFTVKTDACALLDQLVFRGKKHSTSALARLL